MNSTSPAFPRISLEGKTRLPQKVQESLTDGAGVCQQILKSSRSADTLQATIKSFTAQEATIEQTDTNLKRMVNICGHLNAQSHQIQKAVELMTDVQDQLKKIESANFI